MTNVSDSSPRIYVACLAAYNNGYLHGAWIDADQDADQIRDEIASMLARSPVEDAEEYAIHDYEGFEGVSISEYTGIDSVARMAAFIAEHGALGAGLLEQFGGDLGQAETAMQDCYHGQFASLADYMEELTTESVTIGLFGKTAFMAERVLGNVVSSGIKVLVLAVIIGIGSTLFSQFTAGFGGATPTIDDAMAIVLAALSLLGLGIFGPGIANGIVSGGPQLGAGAAVGTGLAVGGAAIAAGGATMLAAKGGAAALSGGAAAVRSGAATAGAATAAYSVGSLGQSGAAGVASGLGGVARAAGSAAISPLKRAAARTSESVKSSFSEGVKAGFGATGGSSTMGTVGGASADPSAAPSGPAGSPPAWAQRMQRRQSMNHGTTMAAHAVRSGDSHGGGSSINLSESDRS